MKVHNPPPPMQITGWQSKIETDHLTNSCPLIHMPFFVIPHNLFFPFRSPFFYSSSSLILEKSRDLVSLFDICQLWQQKIKVQNPSSWIVLTYIKVDVWKPFQLFLSVTTRWSGFKWSNKSPSSQWHVSIWKSLPGCLGIQITLESISSLIMCLHFWRFMSILVSFIRFTILLQLKLKEIIIVS